MTGKKSQIMFLKIIGAAMGSVGFIVWALSTTKIGALIGTGLIGIGSIFMVGGS